MDEIHDKQLNKVVNEVEAFLIEYLKADIHNQMFEEDIELRKRIKKIISSNKEKGLPVPHRFGT